MSKYRWIIGASLLLLPGIIGIGMYSAQKRAWSETYQKATAAAAQNQVLQEYLRMYEEWSHLPADQKGENPWGQGQYGGPEIQKKLREGQSDRLVADLPDLENQVTHFPRELTEVMYGSNWHQRLEEYQRDRSRAELLLIGATFFLACGSIVTAGVIVKWGLGAFLKKAPAEPVEGVEEALAEATDAGASEGESAEEDSENSPNDNLLKKEPHAFRDKGQGYFQNRSKDRQPVETAGASQTRSSFMEQFASTKSPAASPGRDEYFGWAVELEEKPELKTMMTSEPLTKELSDLTEEVSAIRHFAAQQQDQMRKLQDGYDWMIVRRFCLRIIRCIDNLEDRIAKLDKEDEMLSDHLQDVRDELVFALESSGVERYEPDLNVCYKGLERYAEAIKERVETADRSISGCIAEVVRSGYQYLVNDDDVKIVRCAQVKLYEFTQNQ